MTKQTTPATSLPKVQYEYEVDDYGDELWFGGDDCGLATITNGSTTLYTGGRGLEKTESDAAYIVQAANAYPKAQKLAEALKRIADDDGYWGKFAREALAEWETK